MDTTNDLLDGLGAVAPEAEPKNTFELMHNAGFDNGVVKREPKEYVSRLYLQALKTMSVSAVYMGLEAFGDKHLELSRDPNRPFQREVQYPVIVYTSWNSNERFLVKQDSGWLMYWDMYHVGREKKRFQKLLSPGRVAAILSGMKKRVAKGFRMRLELGGQED